MNALDTPSKYLETSIAVSCRNYVTLTSYFRTNIGRGRSKVGRFVRRTREGGSDINQGRSIVESS